MDILRPYITIGKQNLDWGIKTAENIFNQYIQYVDFTAFCILYSLFLLWLLKKLNRQTIFRPKNIQAYQDIGLRKRLVKKIKAFIVSLPIIKQIVDTKFQKELTNFGNKFLADIEKDRDGSRARRLPQQGMKPSNIQARMKNWFEIQQKKMFSGKNSGAIYAETVQHCQQVSTFAAKYMYHNPLHLDTYKEVGKMQAQLLKMTYNLVTKNTAYGVITSGGSQSLIMSLYAYRKYFNKPKPNVVVPHSIHAALDKGAMYFNIQVRKAKLNDKYQVDIDHMKSLIDSNTIALYASYPNYPHGIIDPVDKIALIAKKHKIGFHIDGCLGGFVAGFLKDHEDKFTLDIDGVTSISLDHHKFALAPKGISSLFFKNNELRHQMYYVYVDWVGAIYATPSFPGSRSGFASAGAWYSLTHIGRRQFVENAKRVVQATKVAAEGLSKIQGVKVLGKPELCVFAFQTEGVDCYSVSDRLSKEKNWKISAIHLPRALHVSVTLANCDNIKNKFANDVREVMELLKKQPQKQTQTAALYGASATLPNEAMGQQMLKKFISITFK